MAFVRDVGVVLYKRPYKDKDEWVTMFTRDQGKISALAYGSKSLTSRYRGVLEPLVVIQLELRQTDHYTTMHQASKMQGYVGIGQQLSHTTYAFMLLEMLHHVLPDAMAEPELFRLFLEVLSCIDGQVKPRQGVLYFGIRLFTLLGMFPSFGVCSVSGVTMEGQEAHWSLTDSVFATTAVHGGLDSTLLSPRQVKLLHIAQTSTLSQWLQLRLEDGDVGFLAGVVEEGFHHTTSKPMVALEVLQG